MTKRFTSFVQAVVYLLAFFIITYALKLATQHDPDIRGVELFVMGIVCAMCFMGCMWHMITVLFFYQDVTNTKGFK